jgi:hypothetical protein
VLNVGDTPIPGAVDRLADLRRAGKRMVVLTNAASYTRAAALQKYRRLGFDFTADEVVSSRDVAAARLDGVAPGATWAAITAAGDDLADIPAPAATCWMIPAPWTHPMQSCSCPRPAGPLPTRPGWQKAWPSVPGRWWWQTPTSSPRARIG